AFSVFFVFIALTSDMICFLFIPVHWLFFAASTYVWVQYVWHTGMAERGICLPTISLWLLFVYIEASVRLKEIKNMPFHLDLCRPFAAHCIGYPVVTLGFGFKSYIGYRMRLRKQKEVAKENDFYLQLLQQALPPEPPSITSNSSDKALCKLGEESPPSNGFCGGRKGPASSSSPRYAEADVKNHVIHALMDKHEFECPEPSPAPPPPQGGSSSSHRRPSSVNDFDASAEELHDKTAFKVNGVCGGSNVVANAARTGSSKWSQSNCNSKEPPLALVAAGAGGSGSRRAARNNFTTANNNLTGGAGGSVLPPAAVVGQLHPRDDHYQRWERMGVGLGGLLMLAMLLVYSLKIWEIMCSCELRQIKKFTRGRHMQRHKLQSESSRRTLQKKKKKKKKGRHYLFLTSATPRSSGEEVVSTLSSAIAACFTLHSFCCKQIVLENECASISAGQGQIYRSDLGKFDITYECDITGDTLPISPKTKHFFLKKANLCCFFHKKKFPSELPSLFTGMQINLQDVCVGPPAMLTHKEKEVDELKTKIAEVMAVMPASTAYPAVSLDSGLVSSLLYSPKFITVSSPNPPSNNNNSSAGGEDKLPKSNLDPNASVYTPKMVPSDH
ncbi:unnamed protein product, partial [Ixodes pacificus]